MSLEMHEEEDACTLSDSTLLRFTTKMEKREKRAVISLTENILSVTNGNIGIPCGTGGSKVRG